MVVGVDPGITGAVAVLVNGELLDVQDMPAHVVSRRTVVRRAIDPAALAALIRRWRALYGPDDEVAIVEAVASRPGQGVASVFSLGHSCGAISGVLATLGVPVVLVAPQIWKRTFSLGKDKKQSIAAASCAFPDSAHRWARAKDHNRAEAVLLAVHGAREHT
jgi:crossover junction endodeoxyribonuclease RuvC